MSLLSPIGMTYLNGSNYTVSHTGTGIFVHH